MKPYRWLVGLLPPGVRRSWGAELESTADAALAEAHERGRLAVARTHLWLLADAAIALPAAWLDALTGRRGIGTRLVHAADCVRQDVRYGLTLWRRAPTFTASTVATLALGMGAAMAIFTVVNGVLLRPMPWKDPDAVALTSFVFWADVEEMRKADAFAAVVPWQGWRAEFPEADGTVGVRHSAGVDPSYFEVLGVEPALGRLFTAADDPDGQAGEIVLSWTSWQNDFGGDPDVVGASVRMEDRAYTVIGVAPRYFSDPLGWPVNAIETSMFRLLQPPSPEARVQRPGPGVATFVRLRPGITAATARAQLEALLAPHYASLQGSPNVSVTPAHEARTGAARSTLLLLAGAGAVLLLIGCGNAANLLLSRGATRMRELTVRGALGAGRRRLLGQLLTESVLIGLAAGLAGTAVGFVGARAIVRMGGEFVPRGEEVLLDHRVVLVAIAVSLATSILCGLLPALRGSNVSFGAAMVGGRGAAGAGGSTRFQTALVVGEIALAVTLTFGAGLLVKSLVNLERVDPGYDEEVLTLRVTLTPRRYDTAERVRLHEEMVRRIEEQPGVVMAAAISFHPLSGGTFAVPVARPGDEPAGPNGPRAMLRSVTPGYLETMGIELRSGRELVLGDREGTEPVIVINESLATALFPDESPLDRRLTFGGTEARIVGVVADVKEFSLDGGGNGVVYVTYGQTPAPSLVPSSTIVVRGLGRGHDLTPAVRAAIRAVDPTVPVAFIRTMRDMMDITLLAPRLRTVLLTTFGSVAALLSALGLAGVIAFDVSRRVPEIAVRMALGARREEVAGGVVRDALRVTLLGVVLGILGALGVGRMLASMIFQVPPNDTALLVAVGALGVVLAIGASWIPARRASRVPPASVLRGL